MIKKIVISFALAPLFYLVIAFLLTFIDPKIELGEGLNFDDLANNQNSKVSLIELQTYKARDEQNLSFAHYPSNSERALILLHGSGYHGSYLAELATYISDNKSADVYVLNIRGHHQSGKIRGDISHIGQLEEDILDLITHIKKSRPNANLTLAGHSSGASLAIRFASHPQAGAISNYLLLAPILGHNSPTTKANSGGWAHISLPRIIGLSMLNNVGITALNDKVSIKFSMPEKFKNGSETLQYSYRLMTNFNVHSDFKSDLNSLPATSLTLVGSKDEAMLPNEFTKLFTEIDKPLKIVENESHFSLIKNPTVFAQIDEWLNNLAN